MNNDLLNLLMQRQTAPAPTIQPQVEPQPLPIVPPTPETHVPPKVDRWKNAQILQDAYRNNWTPNPMLLKASLSK